MSVKIPCPAGCRYRAPEVTFMMMHLAMPHRWDNRAIQDWLTRYTTETIDGQA